LSRRRFRKYAIGIIAVRRGEAPREALRAYRTINRLLREDNGVGTLKEDNEDAVIIRFPGREETEEKYPSVREHGSVDGTVARVGGTGPTDRSRHARN